MVISLPDTTDTTDNFNGVKVVHDSNILDRHVVSVNFPSVQRRFDFVGDVFAKHGGETYF